MSGVKFNKVHAPIKSTEHFISNVLNYVFLHFETGKLKIV